MHKRKFRSHRMIRVGAPLPELTARADSGPDWAPANVRWIRRALELSQALPSGGWYVVGASRSCTTKPKCVRVEGKPLVLWRAGSQIYAAPNSCPHMGASLAGGHVRNGRLVCPWHGLTLSPGGHGSWKPLAGHDDGVLFWVRLDGQGEPTDAPILGKRPAHYVDAVVHMEARCDPQDVLQNRLDPWHGVHFHSHSFGSLKVIDQKEDEITVRVVYKIVGALGVEVDARFTCPDPRTIVMTIVDGEGVGSVVETHARPIAPGRTAIIEATLATSDRAGFRLVTRASILLRPLITLAARRLWIEDAAYAERLYALRDRTE